MERIVKLICAMNDFEENFMCNCGCCDDIMDEFIYDLHTIFNSVDDVNNLAPYIKSLSSKVFVDDNYKDIRHDDIRDTIEDVFRSDIVPKKIVFDYDLVYQNIESSSLLFNYLEDISVEQLICLASKNPKVLYLTDNFSIDTLKRVIKNNNRVALVIDVDVMEDEKLYNTYLYKNRAKFLEDAELYGLYINSLKQALNDDRMKYIHMSDIAHNDISLASFILDIDPRFIAYVGDSVRGNKEIMMKMISIDKENECYLSEELKNDDDIKKLLGNYHELKLQPEYYNYVLNGTKRIELRLNDEKRKLIKIGDTIKFLKEPDLNESFDVKVIDLLHYDSFDELFNDYDISFLADKSMTKEELKEVLEVFYTKEKQEQYGILGIYVELL